MSFYVGGEGTIESLPGAVGKLNGQFPANVTSQITGVPHSFDFKQGLYFGKLTWFATNADTINAQAFIRRENNLSDIDANAAPTHGRTILTHQDRYQLSWRHSAGEFLNQLNVAYDRGEQSTPSVGTGPEYVITRALCDTPNCVNFTSGICPDGPPRLRVRQQRRLRRTWSALLHTRRPADDLDRARRRDAGTREPHVPCRWAGQLSHAPARGGELFQRIILLFQPRSD